MMLPHKLEPVSLVAGPDLVGRYAILTADDNPIHFDPDFAARTPFGRTIVHGTLGLNLVIEMVERTFGAIPENFSLEARFVRPVPVSSKIVAGGTLRDERAGTYDIFVETEAGERAMEGICTLGAGAGDRH